MLHAVITMDLLSRLLFNKTMKFKYLLLTPLLITSLFSCNRGNINIEECLAITALEDNSYVIASSYGEFSEDVLPNIQFSKGDNNWQDVTINDERAPTPTPIAILNKNETIYLKGNNPEGFSKAENKYVHFSVVDSTLELGLKYEASGDVMSLIDNGSCTAYQIPCDYCFTQLFAGTDYYPESKIVSAPKLPALNLTAGCYSYMFFDCEYLVYPPSLPSYDIKEKCYSHMFMQCTSLKYAPLLLSSQTGPYCYDHMFYGNSSLSSIVINIKDWDREGDFPCCFWVSFDGRYPMSQKGTFYCPKELVPDPTDPEIHSETRIPYHWDVITY